MRGWRCGTRISPRRQRPGVATLVAAALAALGALGPLPASAQPRPDDDESALLVAEGRAALGRGDYRRAAAVLDRALRVNPRRVEAYVLRAGVHAARQEYADGVALLRRARTLAPESPEVLAGLGVQLLLAGAHAEAVPLLERVVARWPDQYQAHALLGHWGAGHGRCREAVAWLGHYLRTRPARLAAEDAVHETALARCQLELGEARAARARFAAILTRAPRDRQAQLGVAWATAALDCGAALAPLARVSDLAERHPEILLVEGRCLLALGKPAAALARAERHAALRPGDLDGLALRGEALAARGDLPAARAALEEVVRRAPDRPHLVLRLARVERLAGEPEAAAARLLAAREAGGRGPEWTRELAEALLADGRPAEAVAPLRELAAAAPRDGEARTLLGEALLGTGDGPGALAAADEAHALRSDDGRTRRLLERALGRAAVAAVASGEAAQAEAHLARAVGLGPEDPGTWRNLGAVRLVLGRPADALEPLEAALRGREDDLARLLRGRALSLLGRHEAARRDLEAAAAAAPPERKAAATLELAAALVEAGHPDRAVAALEALPRGEPPDPRLDDAFAIAARAAAAERMRVGDHRTAATLLERAARRLPAGRADVRAAVVCEAAVAEAGGGDHRAARARVRAIEGERLRCPFPPPADVLAIPIVKALLEGTEGRRAERALAKLKELRRRAGGGAAVFLEDAFRWLALKAAAEAWDRGQVDRARALLADARPGGRATESSFVLAGAILDLEEGRLDAAIATFERVAAEEPDALVHLGIAWERKGDPQKALAAWTRAVEFAGVKFAPLREWIAAKRRIFGAEGPR